MKLTTCRNCLEVLSDPTRAKITQILAKKSPLSVGQITAHFKLRQPTISHHLHVLLTSKFVAAQKKGNEVHYSLNKKCHNGHERNCCLLAN